MGGVENDIWWVFKQECGYYVLFIHTIVGRFIDKSMLGLGKEMLESRKVLRLDRSGRLSKWEDKIKKLGVIESEKMGGKWITKHRIGK
jgi:hypothetical protein